MSESTNYPLGYSEGEERRLTQQAALFEDLTADVLRRAGIGPGMHIVDLGCGIGDVSLLASRMVGASGAVLGIDRNAASVETAHRRAAALGADNVGFETAELEDFSSNQRFDAVIGRLVLLYLPDPISLLRRFRTFLRPGGIVVFQEIDMEQVSQVPASELFNRVRMWILQAFKAGGAELNMGSRLLPAFLGAGLPRPEMIAMARVESGPDTQGYTYMVQTLRSLLPLLERNNLAVAAEVAIDTLAERLLQDAVANESLVFLPRMVGAWSRLVG